MVNTLVHSFNNFLSVLLKVFVLGASNVEIHLLVVVARNYTFYLGRIALTLFKIVHFDLRRIIRRY